MPDDEQRIKSVSTDPRSKNRLRFSSNKQRAKNASADVYRSYKRRLGNVTSSASREERVHHAVPSSERKAKRARKSTDERTDKIVVLNRDEQQDESTDDEMDTMESTFASELDLAHDRNASEIFSHFYRDVWHLCQSLPEVLHHATEIVDLCTSYLLSPEATPEEASPIVESREERVAYIANQATTDILHLLAVLARDLRHEIHPHLHSQILPRIVYDLLNPPLPPPDKQPLPRSVTLLEAAFRALSYIFRYDSEPILSETEKEGQDGCLEKMRQYYGATLGHKRDFVRRLSAETFAPLIRKLPTEQSRKRHLRRVLRALAASGDTGNDDMPRAMRRAQSDAVDGVASLLFETARGMSGRLHSRGHFVIRCALDSMTSGSTTEGGMEMLYSVSSAALDKICSHLKREHFVVVWQEVFNAANAAVTPIVDSSQEEAPNSSLPFIMKLINQIIEFKSGIYIRKPDKNRIVEGYGEVVKTLIKLLRELMEASVFARLASTTQTLVLQVLTTSWKALPENAKFASQLSPLLPSILSMDTTESDDDNNGFVVNPATMLAQDLLPYLSPDGGVKLVGQSILAAASKQATRDPERALMLLFSVVSIRPTEEGIDDNDNTFFTEIAPFCAISSSDTNVLIDLCLIDATTCCTDTARIAELCIAVRCIPFLVLASISDDLDDDDAVQFLKKISKWGVDVWKVLNNAEERLPSETDASMTVDDVVVAKSLLLEALSRTASDCIGHGVDSSIAKKCLLQLRPHAAKHLLLHPSSIWTVKGVSTFVDTMKSFDILLNDSPNDVFEALIPNLREKSHFLRLHSLEILASFPARPFVTDHAEIDWTDDLDEEPSSHPSHSSSKAKDGGSTSSGLCDVIETLLKLESTPISFENERQISSCITRIEVLGRSNRIPVLYAEAAANHLLGILYVKFSPIWDTAKKALVSLAGTNESSLWEPLLARIKEVTSIIDSNDNNKAILEDGMIVSPVEHHLRCIAWENTCGADPGLFRGDVATARSNGRVSRHLATDEPTVFGLVWSVLEGAPELTAKNSRAIVPIFLEFLHCQYYQYHGNDPDARELRLENEMEATRALSFTTDLQLGRGSLDKRLTSFLRAFAAVNGPEQLYKHGLLLNIFTCFVASPETPIAQAALSCILKFKQPFAIPYSSHLRGMLKKGELRETMLNFDLSKGSKIIDPEHRNGLIPLVTRILFGRLSASGAISKSSKESPTARRAAILSFLSMVDGKDGELYPLFYLMVRSYIPRERQLHVMEVQEASEKEAIPSWVQLVDHDCLSHLRDQRHEGFLNLLAAAISQFGHGIETYVQSFMAIVLSLCKYAEVGSDSGLASELDLTEAEDAEDNLSRPPPNRKSTIRTLCFRRLAELFDSFASSVEFTPYAKQMWDSLAVSVSDLPVTVAYADKAPALLGLLKTLSSRPQLIPLLSVHDEVVAATIRCISDTSKQSVANLALDFVDNLLSDGLDAMNVDNDVVESSIGTSLVEIHLSLLLQQFAIRLGSNGLRKQDRSSEEAGILTPPQRGVNTQCTRRRELDLLCRVSSLIVDKDGDDIEAGVSQMLCELLIPFLSPNRRSSEQDQMNVMEILSALLPRIESEVAIGYYFTLSRLFGPYKAQRGITSLAARSSLASLVATVAAAGSSDDLESIAAATVRLCSLQSKRIDEIDYDEVLAVLNDLGSDETSRGWSTLYDTSSSKKIADPAILSPLVCLCFHFLYDDDGVVSRAALKSLKSFVSCAAREANVEVSPAECQSDVWVKFVETSIVPFCRHGLSSKDKSIRRLFIMLFAAIARHFDGYASPNLYGDLNCLIRDDGPDLDFFMNITHVQIHRRSRAFQRLTKILVSDTECLFSVHSLSNFLLPLAMHPIYESKTKLEEALALDAVETVGAISRHLSWNKYHGALWTLLTQFERHSEQERYIVGAICSVIDSFHFDLIDETRTRDGDTNAVESSNETAVWKALERRIIPKVESLLMKEKVDRSGNKVRTLRPSVVLALSKLFQKFPVSFFEARLSRLVVVICGALRSRDSDAREVARKTLARMVVAMDVKYLSDVVRQLAVSLTEGYQLHVRMATLHTILQELSNKYEPSLVAVPPEDVSNVPFDECIPAMMDLIQQDLFGDAMERKEADGAMKRLVKEASGSKSTDAIELICRMLTFVPSVATQVLRSTKDSGPTSPIHSVVTPLLERLQVPDATTRTMGRVGECLTRVVVGVSHNKTATSNEVLPFVYSCIAPFVSQYNFISPGGHDSDSDGSDGEDNGNGIRVSLTTASGSEMTTSPNGTTRQKTGKSSVVEWRPSMRNASTNALGAREATASERRDRGLVQDGASAPKLTGSGRLVSSGKSPAKGLNDPAALSGVTFGLSLLSSSLKKRTFDADDESCQGMLDPFIPMLTACVCECRNNDVILLSLRSLGVLLRLKLPSTCLVASSLGTKTLDILTSSGNISNMNQELTQACFKTLTLLIHLDAVQSDELVSDSCRSMPLDDDQMQVLISLLSAAVVESDHHHPTLGLIKAIVSRQFVSSEFYDLMNTMLDLSVKSHKSTLREQSSKIFMQYLVGYPMGEARVEDHLKQVVVNVKYEYEEGRLSAISLANAIIEKLPVELLEKHSQLFFLPLVLQFVNDESKACREALSACISRLLSRAPMEVVHSFYDYTERWSVGNGPLKRTSLQLFGIFVDARADFLRKGDAAIKLVARLYENVASGDDENDWEIQYYALLCLEKLSNSSSFRSLLDCESGLWVAVVASLVSSHSWIRQVSSRMVGSQLSILDPDMFASNESHFLVQHPGLLYKIARNLCSHLDLDETEQNEDLTAGAVKSLVWIVRAMKCHPELCYGDDKDTEEKRNPVTWLMARLSNIAKPKGGKRREGIFKCFAAFATVGGFDLVIPYLELILEPLHRSITESDKMMESIKSSTSRRKQLVEESDEAILARDVLHLMEETCSDDSEAFLRAYGVVKTRAREKREQRKKEIATEAIVDPQASAMRKMKKHEQEKRRRKRKVEGHRQNRGAKAKKRHL